MNREEKDFFNLISLYRKELMGFAALWILFFHEWVRIFPTVPVLGEIEFLTKTFGYIGVDIFFFLSGMGLCIAIDKYSLSRFYAKRFIRILFPFFLVEAVGCIITHRTFLDYIKMISGFSFVTTSIFSVLWFVPAIAIYYLIFPLYHKLFSKAQNQVLYTIAAIEIWLLLSVKLNSTMRWDLFGVTNRIPVFLIGVLLGWYGKNKKEIKCNRTMILAMFTTLLLGLYLCYLTDQKSFFFMVQISNVAVPAMLVAISLSFFLAYFLDMLKKATLLKKFLGFFGTISFELYCVQEMLGNYLHPLMLNKMPNIIVNLLFLVAVSLVAYIVYFINSLFCKLVSK